MAAVIELHTGHALAFTDRAPARPGAVAPAGPRLRVIQGGRSTRTRRMRRIFLIRRAAVLAAALVAIWLVVQLVGAGVGDPARGAQAPATSATTHTIRSGDTLWALASSIDDQADPRDVVDRIIELNGGSRALGAADQLRVGATLRLPAGS